ncbi:MAG TPA: NmrA family NAD(P)-binding protein [Trebonia sp.]|nr:NmrA family NAD(P)-binding protein [Trebonia sp.]
MSAPARPRPLPARTCARDHWDTEEHIKASGLAHTFLRDNVYSDLFPYLAGEDGVIRGAAGDGRVAGIAQDDIAEAATAVLQSPATHVGSSYELTGPEALTLADVADLLTHVTGRKITYEPEGREEAYESRRPFADAQWQLDGWVSTYLAIAASEMAQVSDGVVVLTGREPISAEALLRSL